MTVLLPWLLFLISAAFIVIAGIKLSEYGDRLADETGMGGLWVGVVLMAAATSLPEIFTVVSASLLETPELAAGDLFGAVMTNMFTLGLVDLFHRQKRVWQQAALDQTLIASLAIALTGLAGLFVLLKPGVALYGVGLDSLTLPAIYFLGMRLVFRQESLRRRQQEQARLVETPRRHSASTIKRSTIGFALAAIVLVVSAPMLAYAAKTIAAQTGLSETTIGTSLVAITTSLPELVTTFAAVRMGAFDLAVGNLFGSNAFNIAALFVADVAYRPGPLFSTLGAGHAVAALIGIVMMTIGLMGIIYRAERRFILIEPDSLLMLIAYGIGLWSVFHVG